jgi:hypothetical protein
VFVSYRLRVPEPNGGRFFECRKQVGRQFGRLVLVVVDLCRVRGWFVLVSYRFNSEVGRPKADFSLRMGHSFDKGMNESECRFALATRLETIAAQRVTSSAADPRGR